MRSRLRPHPADASNVLGTVSVLGGGATPATSWLRRPTIGRQDDRDLPHHLVRELGGIAAIRHDVHLTEGGGAVDHLVVAPSGVWLIEVIHVTGRITRRDAGTRAHPESQLLLDDEDATSLVDPLGTLAVGRAAVASMQFGVDVQSATCLVDASWPMSARPFQVNGHWVVWPRALTDKIRSSGLIPIRTAHDIADEIDRATQCFGSLLTSSPLLVDEPA